MHHTTLSLTAAALAALIALPAHAANGARMLQRADVNGDGVIERSEVEQARVQRFDRMDANRDGAVDRDELAGLCRRAPAAGAAQPGPGRHCGARLLERADRDGDGRVSREEFMSRPHPGFDRADANRDGRLTADELAALPGRPCRVR
ncbi:MAG: EF-hand domain-containing protein [Gammaproteobacteria bacterium]|jgi:Ca2+-binding EF-hand superfamily protein|nr:EF-hand domain-containing protein [Gammaproteobacteria bacterium]